MEGEKISTKLYELIEIEGNYVEAAKVISEYYGKLLDELISNLNQLLPIVEEAINRKIEEEEEIHARKNKR